jgi:hypothetical protein
MKKIRTMILVALICSSAGSASVYAAAASRIVDVSLADFPVTLNGWNYDNRNSNYGYPFLMYKGIAYFPMTYNKADLLNLKAAWTAESGLIITVADSEEWKECDSNDGEPTENAKRQKAAVVTENVSINGKQIDNGKEPYPLLLFRDITYFPLTWRFAVEEFGWSYSFDSEEGLFIRADNAFFNQYVSTYIKGDIVITISKGSTPTALNESLTVERAGIKNKIDGCFGYTSSGDTFPYAPAFTVKDGWIYTTVTPSKAPFGEDFPCRVNIATFETEPVDRL